MIHDEGREPDERAARSGELNSTNAHYSSSPFIDDSRKTNRNRTSKSRSQPAREDQRPERQSCRSKKRLLLALFVVDTVILIGILWFILR